GLLCFVRAAHQADRDTTDFIRIAAALTTAAITVVLICLIAQRTAIEAVSVNVRPNLSVALTSMACTPGCRLLFATLIRHRRLLLFRSPGFLPSQMVSARSQATRSATNVGSNSFTRFMGFHSPSPIRATTLSFALPM